MKALLIAVSALLLAGCESSRNNPPLTADQAAALCVQLANDRAEAVYHRRPFENMPPAQFEDGRWIWRGSRGVGLLDYAATVQLGANGSTNHVEVQLTDSSLHVQKIIPYQGSPHAPVDPNLPK